jgi:4-amino-4-deoxy-L-arabinose transferase-like glycosyltransferase
MEQAKLETPGATIPSPRSARSEWLLSAALAILLFWWMAAVGTRLADTLSVTRDEPGHLSAGLSGWRNGDYRQSTGNLFFAQKWAAWPLFRKGLGPPDPALQRELDWNPLLIGEALLFSDRADPLDLLAPARRMTLVLCLVTGALVWGWAAWLAGPWAGALAALLYATSPVVLANGVLVTTDTAAAFWYIASLASYAWLLRRPSALPAAATGLCAAMMLLSKFSVVAWMSGAGLLLLWHLWRQRGRYRTAPLAGWHAGACAVAWVAIWAFFGCEFRPGGFAYIASVPSTAVGRVVAFLWRWHALPEPYLREVLAFADIMKPRPAYLFGEFRMGGFWDYFPVAFLAKSTVAMLLALGAWLFVRLPERPEAERLSIKLSPVFAGALGYAAVAMLTPLNIGVRHILPLFVLTAVAGGVALARAARMGWVLRAFAGSVALLAAAEGFSARRQPLAWFNALAGGPMSGFRIMVDSSLEWGGDLPDLIAWEAGLRKADRDSPLFVCLLGPPGHEHFGLPATNMEWAFENGRIRAGYFVFGATRLVGGPVEFYGQWSEKLRHEWNVDGAPAWRGPLPHTLAQLAVARLAASCRRLAPTERIGPVYFVYHLDEGALERALGLDEGGMALDGRARPGPAEIAALSSGVAGRQPPAGTVLPR